MTLDQQAQLEKEAIAEIKEGLAAHLTPDNLHKPFCPGTWGPKYKEALGSYKSWLLTKPEEFVVVDVGNHCVVRVVGDPGIEELKNRSTDKCSWTKNLNKAWTVPSSADGQCRRETPTRM